MFFDIGRDQLIAFMEPHGIPDLPAEYDAGINRGLGLPAAFYHFAFEAGSEAALLEKRNELRAKNVEVTEIFDHGWSKSIYFKDPNGLSLAYCCVVRNLTKDDATMQERFTVRLAALDLSNATSAEVSGAQSPTGNRVRNGSLLYVLINERRRRRSHSAKARMHSSTTPSETHYRTNRNEISSNTDNGIGGVSCSRRCATVRLGRDS
jgi:hypothetical protein